MNASYEKIEANKVKLIFTVTPERFEEGLKDSYLKNKSKVNIPGFRKGKVPRQIIEVQYGKELLYPDAVEFVFPDSYEAAIKELMLEPISSPEVDVLKVSKEEGVEFAVEVFVEPEVNLTEYKGLTYTPVNVNISDDEIDAEIDKEREKNARMVTITDRPSQKGDSLLIDYTGYIDGVAFDGGAATDYDILLGSNVFIDNFEQQLENHYASDEFHINVTFPEDYQAEDLAGKEASFKIFIHEVREKQLPDADDEFAQDISDFETIQEYRDDLIEKLTKVRESNAQGENESLIIERLCASIDIEIPEPMIENELNKTIDETKAGMQKSGLTYEMYLMYMNLTDETYRESLKPGIIRQITARLALKEIAKRENFVVTEEDREAEIDKLVELYNYEKEMLVKIMSIDSQRENFDMDIKVQKALKLLVDTAVIVNEDNRSDE